LNAVLLLSQMHETLRTWGAVASALEPYRRASPAAWWALARGEKVTREKVKAVLAYHRNTDGCDDAQDRCGVTTTRATPEQNARRMALGVTWRDVYEAGLSALELLSPDGENG
jgi:hypothetical protein